MAKGWATRWATVASWFVLNVSIGNLTKTLYVSGFRFPLFLTAVHMFCSFMCTSAFFSATGRPVIRRRVYHLSLSFAVSVGFGNQALAYIYPSFNQMLGATSPLVTLLLAVVMTGRRFNRWAMCSMVVISLGVGLCTTGELHFHPLGMFFSLGSTVLRGVKSIWQGELLQSCDSVQLLHCMAPVAGGLLFALSAVLEGRAPYAWLMRGEDVGLVALSGLTACLLNIANFLVTAATSAVTLQVLGNVKTVLAIAFSSWWFANPVSLPQVAGSMLCIAGVIAYEQHGKSR